MNARDRKLKQDKLAELRRTRAGGKRTLEALDASLFLPSRADSDFHVGGGR